MWLFSDEIMYICMSIRSPEPVYSMWIDVKYRHVCMAKRRARHTRRTHFVFHWKAILFLVVFRFLLCFCVFVRKDAHKCFIDALFQLCVVVLTARVAFFSKLIFFTFSVIKVMGFHCYYAIVWLPIRCWCCCCCYYFCIVYYCCLSLMIII